MTRIAAQQSLAAASMVPRARVFCSCLEPKVTAVVRLACLTRL